MGNAVAADDRVERAGRQDTEQRFLAERAPHDRCWPSGRPARIASPKSQQDHRRSSRDAVACFDSEDFRKAAAPSWKSVRPCSRASKMNAKQGPSTPLSSVGCAVFPSTLSGIAEAKVEGPFISRNTMAKLPLSHIKVLGPNRRIVPARRPCGQLADWGAPVNQDRAAPEPG